MYFHPVCRIIVTFSEIHFVLLFVAVITTVVTINSNSTDIFTINVLFLKLSSMSILMLLV